MSSNPAPRPALARTETGLTRPQLRRRETAPSPVPEPTPVVAEESSARPDKAQAKSGGKADKSKKAKHVHKDSPKEPEKVEVTVALTKLSRKALKDAAHERDMTPEDLASLVLSAWLDR